MVLGSLAAIASYCARHPGLGLPSRDQWKNGCSFWGSLAWHLLRTAWGGSGSHRCLQRLVQRLISVACQPPPLLLSGLSSSRSFPSRCLKLPPPPPPVSFPTGSAFLRLLFLQLLLLLNILTHHHRRPSPAFSISSLLPSATPRALVIAFASPPHSPSIYPTFSSQGQGLCFTSIITLAAIPFAISRVLPVT